MPQATPLRALIVEDDPLDAELLLHELRRSGFQVEWRRVESKEEYLAGLDAKPDIIYSDFNLPQFDGLKALDLLVQRGLDIPFIIVSGVIGEDRAVEVMRRGAWDYLLKDRLARIGEATRQALEKRGLQQARAQAEEVARAAGDALQAIVEAAPLAIVAIDPEGRIQTWNPAAEKLFGWRADEVLNRCIGTLDGSTGNSLPSICGSEPGAGADEVETVCHRKDGSRIDVGVWTAPLHDETGRVSGSIRMLADISERRRQQERIDRLMRVQTVLSEINATIVRVRDRGSLLKAACRIAVEHGGFSLAWIGLEKTGGSGELAIEASAGAAEGLRPLLKGQDFSAGFADLQLAGAALHEGKGVFSNRLPAARGVGMVPEQGGRFGSMVALPLRVDGQLTGVFAMYAAAPGFFTDEEMHLLTEMAADVSFALDYLAKAETVSYLAYHDSLTDLPNRQLLQERVEQFVRTQGQEGFAAILVFDPERFRNLNDTLGRQAGDDLLRQIAARVKGAVRESDTPARLGGDVFAVFLNGVQGVEGVAHVVEEKLLEALSQPFKLGDEELRVSIRIGIALFPTDGGDADTLLRNAEAAQKRAREYGEKYLFYGPGMNARVSRALALENKLRRAQENGEFILHYQPKINLLDGHLAGVEALLRWRDPETGDLVLPARFIPLLEETGLIFEVGRWALGQAVEDRHRWMEHTGQAPRVAVNASTIQLLRKDFHAEVAQVVSGNGNDAAGLELEITESALMQDFEKNIQVLQKIRDMGIGIAIDDFGTGYSSLGYLSKLPVTVLKIDYSFVRDMVLRPEGMALVSTIISLGRTFNFRVIAEGVETEEQARLLRLLRCDEGQGFLFGEAVPADAIEKRLMAPEQDPNRH